MKNRLHLLSLLTFFLMPLLSLAQQPGIVWEKSFGGTRGDLVYDVTKASDGRIAFCGSTSSVNYDVTCNTDSLNYDYWIFCIDTSGNLLWSVCYGGFYDEDAKGIAATRDGGFIVAGHGPSADGDETCNTDNPPETDYWVLKLDSTGHIQWQNCYGGSSADLAYDIVQTSDGGFLVTGQSRSFDGDVTGHHGTYWLYDDYWIVKLDSLGSLQWEKSLGGSDDDYALGGIEFSPGRYVVIGQTNSSDGDLTTTNGGGSCWVVMLDSAGNIVWQEVFGGSAGDQGRRLLKTPGGDILCLMMSGSQDGDIADNHGAYDYVVMKLDSAGALLWIQAYGGAGEELPRDIALTPDSGFVVIGLSQNSAGTGQVTANYGYNDYWAVKADKNGILQWEKNFGGSREDLGWVVLASEDLYLGGSTASFDFDVSSSYDTSGFGADAWILRLDGYTSVNNPPAALEPWVVAPNPANSRVQVTLQTAASGAIVRMTDLTGREVYRSAVHNGSLPIDVSRFPPALYLLSLTDAVGHILARDKLIIQR